MNPKLKVNRAQHSSSDLLSHRWQSGASTGWPGSLTRVISTSPMTRSPDRRKPERVMVQHGACPDNPTGET
jgi:hypothetical protein